TYFNLAPTQTDLSNALGFWQAHTEEQALAYVFAQQVPPPQGFAAQQQFVKNVYQAFLHRQPSATELQSGQATLTNQGVYGLVLSVLTGLEYRRLTVAGYFAGILRQQQPP